MSVRRARHHDPAIRGNRSLDQTLSQNWASSAKQIGSHHKEPQFQPVRRPKSAAPTAVSWVGSLSSEAIGEHTGVVRQPRSRPSSATSFYPIDYHPRRPRSAAPVGAHLRGAAVGRESDSYKHPRDMWKPLGRTDPAALHYEAQFNRTFGGRMTSLTDDNTRAAASWQKQAIREAAKLAEGGLPSVRVTRLATRWQPPGPSSRALHSDRDREAPPAAGELTHLLRPPVRVSRPGLLPTRPGHQLRLSQPGHQLLPPLTDRVSDEPVTNPLPDRVC
jgi:hypothetical protein